MKEKKILKTSELLTAQKITVKQMTKIKGGSGKPYTPSGGTDIQ